MILTSLRLPRCLTAPSYARTHRRFVYGYIRGMIQRRACPVKVSIKVAESDKRKMVTALHTARTDAIARIAALSSPAPSDASDAPDAPATDNDLDPDVKPSVLPPLRYRDHVMVEGDGWIVFDKPLLYLYAGKGPFVSRDLMQFPVSHPDDGYIDVVIQEHVSRFWCTCTWELISRCGGTRADAYVRRRGSRCSPRWTVPRWARTTGSRR